jgi:phospholipase/carboxylesterase
VQVVPHHYQVSVPDGNSGQIPVLIGLHGYAGDMGSMLRIVRAVAGDDIMAASLQGPHQFWFPSAEDPARRVGFGWLTPFKAEDSHERHHEFICRVVGDLNTNFGADRSRVFLMGFSQACALNYRFAFTHPGFLRGVIGVCGGIPGDFRQPKYREIDASVLHILATEDQFYSLERARGFEPELKRLAPDVTFREYPSAHAFPRRAIPDIRRWVLERCGSDRVSPPICR